MMQRIQQQEQARDWNIASLKRQFPDLWMQLGEDFAFEYDSAIWTGEGSSIKDQPAFSYYGYTGTGGIHPDLARALDRLGLYAEFRDPGTVFIWPR